MQIYVVVKYEYGCDQEEVNLIKAFVECAPAIAMAKELRKYSQKFHDGDEDYSVEEIPLELFK
jgi:hypothetical protein